MSNSYYDQAVKLAPEGAKPDQVHPTPNLRYWYDKGLRDPRAILQQQVRVTWNYEHQILHLGLWTFTVVESIWMEIPCE
jgi:hypothetical protein